MTRDELLQIITEVQSYPSELEDVEVKSAHDGTPERLFEGLSAFSNRDSGGVILHGLDQATAFAIVGVGDAHRLQEDIGNLAASEMEPPLRPDFTVEQVDGRTVVAVGINGMLPAQRPCFYKPAGLQKGSYIRVGLSNRLMSDYEIFSYVSGRDQPKHDSEPIVEATIDDLDGESLNRHIDELKRARQDAAYLQTSFSEILVQLRIARVVDGVLRPTRAGLLAFGKYPQLYEPQLVITFLHYYGASEEEKTPQGERFLDNRKFEGAIPQMVQSVTQHIMASIRKAGLIEGLYRREIPEYPDEALREAVVNAVAHRDYSGLARGSQIQIRLFANRLEIRSPGGLFGNVSAENLEESQSTRNLTLMRIMEDLHLAENRGSGIKTMIEAMRAANLEPPQFVDKRTGFWVVLRNHTLMNPENIRWLNQFADQALNDYQRLALVYLRLNNRITNPDYRRLNRVDTVEANRGLRGLMDAGLAQQHSTKRWAYYTLVLPHEAERPLVTGGVDEGLILAFVRESGSITNRECRALLTVDRRRARYLLGLMSQMGVLKLEGAKRTSRYVLP